MCAEMSVETWMGREGEREVGAAGTAYLIDIRRCLCGSMRICMVIYVSNTPIYCLVK
jgi:hypothetical protein